VGNFLSFDEPQSLSLLADVHAKERKREFSVASVHLLKFAAIFGANAAGKSNVIKAMTFAHSLIKQGTDAIDNPQAYCRLRSTNKEKASYFEFEIALRDRLFAYGFEVIIAKKTFTEEWLVELSETEEHVLFSRDTHKKNFHYDKIFFDEKFGLALEQLKTNQNSLLLQGLKDSDFLGELYTWFDHLFLASPTGSLIGYSAIPIEDWNQISKAIAHFATGITEIQFSRVSEKVVVALVPMEYQTQFTEDCAQARKKGISYRLQIESRLFLMQPEGKTLQFSEAGFAHQGALFTYDEESDGTRRLLALLSVLVTLQKGSVAIIDEIDRSLHPKLTLQFVKNYLELARTRDLQLVVTTHESLLLNLELLRRDEIFFVEKNREGASIIYPFDQFQRQFDTHLEQAYLSGRYGGIPHFGNLYLPEEDEV
ncbi:MAG: AAA family ATPase, partial [Sphaerochaetaceae bacterium]